MCWKFSKKRKKKAAEEKAIAEVRDTEQMTNSEYYIAWWNVENLFDVEDYEHRTDKLQRTIGNEVKGWTAEILDKKLSRLSDIINSMNDNKGPDLLGVCEIENDNVLKKLVSKINTNGRNYQLAHHDCSDKRGVDVAILFDGDKFEKGLEFSHVIMKRVATRDIYQVNFKTKATQKDFVVIVNHWPARSAGTLESEPYRIVAGETLSYWNKRIHEILGDDIAIIVMGDFNDEPFNRSITDYALGSTSKMKVRSSTKAPRLLNLMWTESSKGVGTHFYRGDFSILDQFMISKGFLTDEGLFEVDFDSIEIINFDRMKEGKYGNPIRFGRPKSKLNENGYSDHFPIGMKIKEK
ncbi:MAG: endonuclease/exonuclease/phosphatase family protein [Candidatus Heimdallarchaeota archaeon]